MLSYIGLRLIQGLITAFVLLTIVFVFARITGDPIDLIVPADASLAERREAAVRLGLDQSEIVQYYKYLEQTFKGDFGTSIRFQRPVTTLFADAVPNTLRLAGLALLLALALGIPLGVLAATRRAGAADQATRAIAALALSAPEFWIGIMLIFIFAVSVRLLPVSGIQGPSSYILPALTLSLPVMAGTARLLRSSLIEALDSEYIKLARIKGASQWRVVGKHGLRNAVLPVITFLGIRLAGLINGSVTVETVFAWPGVGRLMYSGVQGKDYPLEQGLLLILGLIVIALNLAIDILYTVIDPRIRLGSGLR
jgi:peptide/nickel transport system permease protein